MNEKRKRLLLCLAIPLAAGGLSALLTRNSMERFASLAQPPLTPPGKTGLKETPLRPRGLEAAPLHFSVDIPL